MSRKIGAVAAWAANLSLPPKRGPAATVVPKWALMPFWTTSPATVLMRRLDTLKRSASFNSVSPLSKSPPQVSRGSERPQLLRPAVRCKYRPRSRQSRTADRRTGESNRSLLTLGFFGPSDAAAFPWHFMVLQDLGVPIPAVDPPA